MDKTKLNFLSKKANHLNNIIWFAFLLLLLSFTPILAGEYSPATQSAFAKFQILNDEIGKDWNEPGEHLLNCSYLQDIWLAYLHDAETKEDYYRGMEFFQNHSQNFTAVFKYLTTGFNIFTAQNQPSSPQSVKTTFNGKEVWGYLNTFKFQQALTPRERSDYFWQEYSKFLEDGIAYPFILNESTIHELEPNTIYNYVLLPEGTILAAVERPGKREYHVLGEAVLELFLYPNHTILSGHPEQVVVTAGAFILHRIHDKSLIFISCKSGHFQPAFNSLEHMQSQLVKLGINPCTIISVPEVDMSRPVLKAFSHSKIPVILAAKDMQDLFQLANERWQTFYQKIDRQVLLALARNEADVLTEEIMELLKKQREEATYMRSAYHLFSFHHQPPQYFNKLVKRFGKLKSPFKYYGTPQFQFRKIQKRASKVLNLIEMHENEMVDFEFAPAHQTSFYQVLAANISEMQELLSACTLSLEEYHQLKKLARETGALFMYMASEVEFKGKGFLIFRTISDGFFQINELMSKTDYTYVEQQQNAVEEARVILSRKIANLLIKYLSHLEIPSLHLNLDTEN